MGLDAAPELCPGNFPLSKTPPALQEDFVESFLDRAGLGHLNLYEMASMGYVCSEVQLEDDSTE